MATQEFPDSFACVRGFEWDDNKRATNVVKHKIDFADATAAFGDPDRYTYRSPSISAKTGIPVGAVHGRLIAVVFIRRGDKLRIISARSPWSA